MSQPMWTVIAVDESTGQVIADHVHAEDSWAAFAAFARQRSEYPDLTLIGAVPDHLQVATPCESGACCCVCDYPVDDLTDA
jgi:hypothetical protein